LLEKKGNLKVVDEGERPRKSIPMVPKASGRKIALIAIWEREGGMPRCQLSHRSEAETLPLTKIEEVGDRGAGLRKGRANR